MFIFPADIADCYKFIAPLGTQNIKFSNMYLGIGPIKIKCAFKILPFFLFGRFVYCLGHLGLGRVSLDKANLTEVFL